MTGVVCLDSRARYLLGRYHDVVYGLLLFKDLKFLNNVQLTLNLNSFM